MTFRYKNIEYIDVFLQHFNNHRKRTFNYHVITKVQKSNPTATVVSTSLILVALFSAKVRKLPHTPYSNWSNFIVS